MDSHLILYSIGGVIAIPLILKTLIILDYYVKRRSLTNQEYNNSRGTTHKKMLQNHIKKIKNLIKKEENLLKKHQDKKSQIEKGQIAELEKAATTYMFHRDFITIPGIGKKLKERVERNVFNGTLDSLYRSNRIHGIGEAKYSAIRHWIENIKRAMPRILSSNFNGKTEILKKYEKQLTNINNDIIEVQKRLSPLQELQIKSESEQKKLDKVTAQTFIQSYNGNEQASQLVTEYYHGLFPEWNRMPSWFRNLMEATS